VTDKTDKTNETNETQVHSHPVLRQPVREKHSPDGAPTSLEVSLEVLPVEPENATPRLSMVQYADGQPFARLSERYSHSEDLLENRSVLFVGSEQYDGHTITILEGLAELDFDIYTLHKPNVSSWRWNQVIDSTAGREFDFVLSNTGWGTRWDYHRRYKLSRFPNVLIDSMPGNVPWDRKLEVLASECNDPDARPDDDMLAEPVLNYRWCASVGSYSPDVTFSALPGQPDTVYLPHGIHSRFTEQGKIHAQTKGEREHLVTYVSPKGILEDRDVPSDMPHLHVVPRPSGEALIPTEIADHIKHDTQGLHGWSEWIEYKGIYQLLAQSHIVLIDSTYPGWTSKLPYQALACCCLLMVEKCCVVSDYPLTRLSPFTVYESQDEFRNKIDWISNHVDQMRRMQLDSTELAYQHFTSVPLARRFLHHVWETLQ